MEKRQQSNAEKVLIKMEHSAKKHSLPCLSLFYYHSFPMGRKQTIWQSGPDSQMQGNCWNLQHIIITK